MNEVLKTLTVRYKNSKLYLRSVFFSVPIFSFVRIEKNEAYPNPVRSTFKNFSQLISKSFIGVIEEQLISSFFFV